MNATLRALVIDDEPLARGLLVQLLARHPDVTLAGQAGDGAAAVRLIQETRPDLVFLDIQMPEKDGFEVLEALDPERLPEVIFVTAYDRYAVKAFEVRALDYLLKPFDEERLAEALARARERLGRRPPGTPIDSERVARLLEALTTRHTYRTRLVARDRDRARLIPVTTVDWLEADGKYVQIHVGQATWLVRETLQKMEESLDPDQFLRISRSAIIRTAQVTEIRPWFGGDHLVVLATGAEIPTTKSHRDKVTRLLGG